MGFILFYIFSRGTLPFYRRESVFKIYLPLNFTWNADPKTRRGVCVCGGGGRGSDNILVINVLHKWPYGPGPFKVQSLLEGGPYQCTSIPMETYSHL